jgi:hypothetical protein
MRAIFSSSCCLVLLGTVSTLSACHRKVQDAGTNVAMAGPSASPAATDTVHRAMRIDALVPDSVMFGPNRMNEIVIRGRGFRPAGTGTHLIRIGMIELPGVPANAAGTEIRVVVPDRAVMGGGAPRPLFPGKYDVIVSTERDTSNAVPLRVLP